MRNPPDIKKSAPEASQGHKVGPQEEHDVIDDPRMIRAVEARLKYPQLSLREALLEGGFEFSRKNSIDDALSTPNQLGGIYDSDNILQSQRKKQLSRRLRSIASCEMKETQQHHRKRKKLLDSNCSYTSTSTSSMVPSRRTKQRIDHNIVSGMMPFSSAIKNMSQRKQIRPNTRGVTSNYTLYGDPAITTAIQELHLLQEQRSLLDRNIENKTMNILTSSSSFTAGKTDHFKPVSRFREGFSSNVGAHIPSLLQTEIDELLLLQQQRSLWYQDLDRAMITPSSSFTAEKADHFKDSSRFSRGISSKNAYAHNPSHLLQTGGIDELHLLQQQQSLWNRQDAEIPILPSSCSFGAVENILLDRVKSPTSRLSINSYPAAFQTRTANKMHLLQKEQLSSLSLLNPLHEKAQLDLSWSTPPPSLLSPLLHHSQNPPSPALDGDNEQSFVSDGESQIKPNSSIY
jgi:hypothetical protein